MKEKIIEELKVFKDKLSEIDANYNSIFESNNEHKIQIETLRNIEIILTDIRSKVGRFYTKNYIYNNELKNISDYLLPYKSYFGEIFFGGISMEDCRLRIIKILEGMINELEKYGIPSKNDIKFDK